MSTSREEGWLETKIGRKGEWIRKWVVFDEGTLTLSNSNDNYLMEGLEQDIIIPTDQVISFRTDVSCYVYDNMLIISFYVY